MRLRLRLLFLLVVWSFAGALASAQDGDLVTAAKRGDLAAVTALLRSGYDVNDRKYTARGTTTALMEAASNGHLAVVQALLAAKADVNATFFEQKDGETALTLAVENGHVEVARALLAAGADVNHSCCGGHVLFHAARTRNVEMLQVLLAAKPELNRVDRIGGRTALAMAIDAGYWDIARLLVEAGADVNRRNKSGMTPLLAVTAANGPRTLEMAQVLLAAHADPNFRDCDKSYMTPLGFASVFGNVAVAQALLQAHADASLAQCDGNTPLALASLNGNLEIVRLLLSAKANLNAKLPDGNTALSLALQNGHTEVVELLRSAAEVNR